MKPICFAVILGISGLNVWATVIDSSNSTISADTVWTKIVGESAYIGDITIWDREHSPYLVQGNVFVDHGGQLNIEPGVEVVFDGRHYLIITGILEAIGTQSQPIVLNRVMKCFSWDCFCCVSV